MYYKSNWWLYSKSKGDGSEHNFFCLLCVGKLAVKITKNWRGMKWWFKLCFQLQITENKNELTSLEGRTKTSESGFGLEIYNIGQTPVFIDYVR